MNGIKFVSTFPVNNTKVFRFTVDDHQVGDTISISTNIGEAIAILSDPARYAIRYISFIGVKGHQPSHVHRGDGILRWVGGYLRYL